MMPIVLYCTTSCISPSTGRLVHTALYYVHTKLNFNEPLKGFSLLGTCLLVIYKCWIAVRKIVAGTPGRQSVFGHPPGEHFLFYNSYVFGLPSIFRVVWKRMNWEKCHHRGVTNNNRATALESFKLFHFRRKTFDPRFVQTTLSAF